MAEDLGSMIVRVGLDGSDFDRGLKNINSQMKVAKSELRATSSRFDGFGKSVDGLKAKQENLAKQHRLQGQRVQELRKQYDELVATYGAESDAALNAANTLNGAITGYNKLERQLEQTEQQLESLRKEVAYQESIWGQSERSLKSFSDRTGRLGENLTSAGRTLTAGITTPILGAGAAAIAVGMNFEESMSKVQAVTGATGNEIAQLEAMAKNLGETTRFSASEAADAMSFLGMAGYDTNQIISSMPGLLDLAAAGQLELGRAADIASNVISGFNLEAEDTGRISDVLAESAASANTSVEQMGGAMSYVAPVAAGAGLSLEETAAAIGTLSNAGIQGERAGTALRSMISSLQNPTGQTAEALEDLGLSAKDVNPTMNSLADIMGTLEDAGVESSQAMQLVGQEAGPGLIALLSQGSKGLNNFTGDLEDSEGAANDMASAMEDNTKGNLREFTSALEGVGIAASEHLLPPLTEIIETGTDLVRKFGELDRGTQKTIITVAGLAAAVGPLSLALGSSFRMVSLLSGGLAKLTGVVGRRFIGNVGKASLSIEGIGKSTKASNKSLKKLDTNAKNSSKSLGGFGKSSSKVGKGMPKVTGLLSKAGGVMKNLGGFTRIASGALRFLGGPMGLLASVAIPGLIKGGTELVNFLREDSIPAVNDFGDEVSESTTKAVLGYKELHDEATAQLNQLNWSGQEVSKEMAENLTTTFGEMGDQISESLKTDFDESYQSLSTFLANSKTLSEKESQEILENMKVKQEEQQTAVQENEDRIKEIMRLASEERRALTQSEKEEINRIQQEMMETAIQTLSDGEVEQRAIMEKLKNESANITARQAAETVQNSIKAKEGSIEEANKKYDEVVKWAIRERDETGSITDKQAEKIINEAERQRDGSIEKATEMHEGVVEQAKEQAEGQRLQVEWATGEVLTNWDLFVVGVADAVNAVTDGINSVLSFIGIKEIPEWRPKGYSNFEGHLPSSYAEGTSSQGHPGGPAIVGEVGPELAYIPNQGVTLLGTRGPELHTNLPRGTAVLPNKETERTLKSYGFPGYKFGVGDFWQMALKGPKALMNKVWDLFPVPIPDVGGGLKNMGIGIVDYLKDNAFDFIKGKIKDLFSFDGSSVGSGVQRWAGVAATALRMTGQYTAANLDRLLYQMQTESGGNPTAINLWDINAQRGIPSKGLMQVIDPTFQAYKMPGFNNIWNPLDNILASIRYAVARYGSLAAAYRGVGYADGTPYNGHPGGLAWVGEEGYELAHIPNRGLSLVGLGGPRLMDLPRGTSVLPHDETKEAMRSFWVPGYADGAGNYFNDSRTESPNRNNRYSEKLLNATLEQNEILMQLLEKDTDIVIGDKEIRKIGKEAELHITKQQQRKNFRRRRSPGFA